MKNWLRKSLATLFAISAMSVPSLASAQGYCGTPNTCDPCGDWDASRFFVTSSTLFWKTCVEHTDYAVSGTDDDAPSLVGGNTHSVNIDWDWGFRLGFGYEFPCGGWDIRANWTRFHTHDHDSTTLATGGTLQASNINPALGILGDFSLTSAEAHATVNYDTLDIVTSKACCVCDDFLIRPYFGARVLWLHRDFDVSYSGPNFLGDDDGIDWKSHYTAGGLHAGMEMLVDLGCDFFLVANAAGSLVAGSNDGQQLQIVTVPDEVGTILNTFELEDDNTCLVSYNYELSLGAKYRTCLCECWNVDWTLAYDFVHWDNVPELVRFTDGSNFTSSTGGRRGSVNFHGISFSSIWRF